MQLPHSATQQFRSGVCTSTTLHANAAVLSCSAAEYHSFVTIRSTSCQTCNLLQKEFLAMK
jgi:hypothetical protein